MGTGGTSVPNGGNREYGVSILKGTRATRRCEPQMYRNGGGTAGDVAKGKGALGKGWLYSGQLQTPTPLG